MMNFFHFTRSIIELQENLEINGRNYLLIICFTLNRAKLSRCRYSANWAKIQLWPLYTPYGTPTHGGYVYQMGSL